jgi:uncharacterized protein
MSDSIQSSPAAPSRLGAVAPAPVLPSQRVESIDVLRGVAVLGILLLNMQSFAMPGSAYMNPTSYGDLSGANYWVWYGSRLLGDQKFLSIFSMLFGAGIVLMSSRIESRGLSSAGVHYRRMGWLILFGLLHAHLLWYGDILYSYGLCGLVAYLFRRLRPAWLIVIGLIALSIPCVINFGLYGLFNAIPEEGREQWLQGQMHAWQPGSEEIQSELDAYRGGWLDQQLNRSTMAALFQTFFFGIWFCWRAGGLMLLGMAMHKLDIFNAARSSVFYGALALVGLILGGALTASEIRLHEEHGWPVMESMYLYSLPHYWGSFFQSLAYVGLVMLLCRSGALRRLQQALAAVGRMALSNYLMQSLICTTIFYGQGFGQFGHFSRVEQLYTFLGVSAAQLAWSPLWLRHFRFGPLEWLWRSLTYWKRQPMRRAAGSS